MSEDILKIMEAIREEAKAERTSKTDSDIFQQGLLNPDILSVIPSDWGAPVPPEKQGPGPVTGTGTADDPYVFGRGTVIRVKKD